MNPVQFADRFRELKRSKAMKYISRFFNILVLFILFVVSLGVTTRSAAADSIYTCFPTCAINDGRFLALAGIGLDTLAGDSQEFEISVPSGTASFEIGIFDGDTGGMWDVSTTPTQYSVYADPLGDGSGSEQLIQFTGAGLPDNDWYSVTINTSPSAQSPSGNYFYHIHFLNTDPATVSQNSFKIRTTGLVEMAPRAFAFIAALNTQADIRIIYPAYPSLTPTTYDGTFNMYIDVPNSAPDFSVWDGDLDYGSYNCLVNDSNDLDTSDAPFLPDWAVGTSATPEGVASAVTPCANGAAGFTTGTPPDDTSGIGFRRSPEVTYDVIFPDGTTYHNDNPSGNQEWEQFRISSNAADVPDSADYFQTGLLPAGIYETHLIGMDLHNLNAWRFIYHLVGVCENDIPCIPVINPFLVGDTIWNDGNGNGIQDIGEYGIPGVAVTLLDLNGIAIPGETAVTDANGNYTFNVDIGTFSVQVDSGNFDSGGVLAGFASTTGGELQSNAVTTDNVLTYDFGYRSTSAIGDLVWKDLNINGIQDVGELGLSGVTVNLLGGDGVTVVDTTTTDGAGAYSFSGVVPDTYYVQFIAPVGMIFTTQTAPGSTPLNDSNASITGQTDAITLSPGQSDNTIDAGLRSTGGNYCGYIRTPGFWKNYSNHMSSATFQSLILHTQDFSYLTVSQAVAILSKNNGITKMGIPTLDGVNATFLKFLLTAEINAVWNGQDNAAGLNGLMGIGIYQNTGMTVNQLLHKAYLHRRSFSSAEKAYVLYLGGNGEGASLCSCRIKQP